MDTTKPTERPTSIVVPLLFPVVHGGATYDQLILRRMKARDSLIGEGEGDETMVGYMLFAALAGVPLDVILDLDMEDLAEVGAAVGPLMGKRAMAMVEDQQAKLTSQSPGVTSLSPSRGKRAPRSTRSKNGKSTSS